jgi:undecaprenyl-diphosphatase
MEVRTKKGALAILELPRVSRLDVGLCLVATRLQERPPVHALFRAASRLGDGGGWLVLGFAQPVVFGVAAWIAVAQMAIACGIGHLLYRAIKRATGRERPYASPHGIRLGGVALDRYSFPSGHTLHAVAFTTVAVAHHGELAWVLVPLASLVALSRVVLGLHYPTDVVAGGVLGGGLGAAALGLA